MDEHVKSRHVLQGAAWFGLVAGLVEGSALLTLQHFDWLGWDIAKAAVSPEIIWISALVDMLLFGTIGLCAVGLGRLFPRLRVLDLSVSLLSLLTFFDWLALTGRIRHYGAFVLALGLAAVIFRWFRKHESCAVLLWRRSVPWVAAVALLALLGIQGSIWWNEHQALAHLPPAPSGAPNVLVVVVDTLRADHLSGYGYTRPTSRNLDRIGNEGVVFENAFATSSWTLPSHASMLTGRFPHEHGAEKTYYDGRYRTLAEELRDRGYRTAAFSGNNLWFSRRRGFGKGFVHFADYFGTLGDMLARTLYGRQFELFVLRPAGYSNILGRKLASDANQELLSWLGHDAARPFFAFVNYFDVHDPYVPPQPYRSRFSNQKSPGGIIHSWFERYYPKMTPEQLQGERDAYDGTIAYVDDQIGQLLGELERRGLSRSTLVVITSDHGESFGEHGLLGHQNSLYREVIQVPLIFRWPGHVPAGVRVSQIVCTASLPATIVELLDGRNHGAFPGPSLAALWESPGDRPDWPYPLGELAQFRGEPVKKNLSYSGAMKSLVSPDWHYIVHEKLGPALFKWRKDPGELKDLATMPTGQSIVSEFSQRLQRLLAKPGGATPMPISENKGR